MKSPNILVALSIMLLAAAIGGYSFVQAKTISITADIVNVANLLKTNALQLPIGATAGDVLSSDATGLASWTPPANLAAGGGFTLPGSINWVTTWKHYFVTAAEYDGNLGGFAGADAKCNSDSNRDTSKTYHVPVPFETVWGATGVGFYNSTYGESINNYEIIGALDTLLYACGNTTQIGVGWQCSQRRDSLVNSGAASSVESRPSDRFGNYMISMPDNELWFTRSDRCTSWTSASGADALTARWNSSISSPYFQLVGQYVNNAFVSSCAPFNHLLCVEN